MIRLSVYVYLVLGLAVLLAAALLDPSVVSLLYSIEDQPQLFRTSEIQSLRLLMALAGLVMLLCVFAWRQGAGRA